MNDPTIAAMPISRVRARMMIRNIHMVASAFG